MSNTESVIKKEHESEEIADLGWVKFRLKVVISLFVLYTFADLITSASSGQSGANRIIVHVAIILMSAFMMISTFWMVVRRPVEVRGRIAPLPFILLPIWIILVDFFEPQASSTATRVGILFWWFSLFSFFRAIAWYLKSFSNWTSLVLGVILLYIGGMLWGASQIRQEYSVDFVVSGYSYFVVGMFPLVRLIPNSIIRNVSLVLIIVSTLVSLKRGAIILLVVFLIAELLFSRRGFLQKFVGVVVGVLFVGLFVSGTSIIDTILQRFAPEELSDGSGRNDIYGVLIAEFVSRDSFEQIIGSGSGSVGSFVAVAAAHNDVLEMFISYGIVGFSIFVCWVASLVSPVLKSIQSKGLSHDLSLSGIMAVLYIIIVGIFSQGIFGHASVYCIALVAYIAGTSDLKDQKVGE